MGTLASELQPFTAASAPPRVYADANIPAGVVAFTRRELGWDVLFVMEHDELRRARDRDHYVRALDLGRTLVTLDHDFLDDRAFPPALSPGVIVCNAPDERALRQVMVRIDREVLRAQEAPPLPLRGRKLELYPVASAESVAR